MDFTGIFILCFLIALGVAAYINSRKSTSEIKKLTNQKNPRNKINTFENL